MPFAALACRRRKGTFLFGSLLATGWYEGDWVYGEHSLLLPAFPTAFVGQRLAFRIESLCGRLKK